MPSAPSLGLETANPAASVPAAKWVAVIVVTSVVYQAVLAYMHTHFLGITTTGVATAELMIYLACLSILATRIRLEFFTLASFVLAYLLMLSILRGELEIKGFRDVMIPVLFYWLGRHSARFGAADKILKPLVIMVLTVGFFELFFLKQYTRLMDIFSYYVSTGTVTISTNFISESSLNLNGMRPEGIGRTLLPMILGSHRVSSVFLEPVSLGNFAVIVAAWGLAKARTELKSTLFFVLSAMILIVLSDSRYGLIVTSVLIFMRVAVAGWLNASVILLPAISILALILIGLFFEGDFADNIMGRLYWTGSTLLEFDAAKLMGLQGFNIPYGDMGYAYLISRWGILLCIALWAALWMIKMPDERGNRFRGYVGLYISLILTVSGTSFFALKTAGLLWFLLGSCSRAEAEKHLPEPTVDKPIPSRELRYAN